MAIATERPPTRRGGLQFADAEAESGYQRWRGPHVLPATRFALISGTIGSSTALVAVLLPPLAELRPLAVPLLSLLLLVHLLGLALLRPSRVHLVQPWSCFTNLVSGVSAVLITEPAGSFTLTAAGVTFICYTGLALSRMPMALGVLTVLATVVLADVRGLLGLSAGELEGQDVVIGVAITLAAFAIGVSLGVNVERADRQAYADHVLIEAQRAELFEERNNLARFLAPEVEQAIRERGLERTLRSEQVDMTALCIDLRGFSAFTHREGAQAMTGLLGAYYEVIVDRARAVGGTVSSFAGDGALVLLGAPLPSSDHAELGFRLARDLRERVTALLRPHAGGPTPLGVGIGLASGTCVAGVIAALTRLEYTVVGSPVNLAARLCAQAQDGEILLSPQTVGALPRRAHWREEDRELKGFDGPVRVTIDAAHETGGRGAGRAREKPVVRPTRGVLR